MVNTKSKSPKSQKMSIGVGEEGVEEKIGKVELEKMICYTTQEEMS